MLSKEMMDFADQNKVCTLATVEGDQPRARMMMLHSCDEKGFTFSTATTRDVYRQLKAHPKVEVCFYEMKRNKMLRAAGRVEFFEDHEIKEEVVKESPCLEPLVRAATNPILTSFRIRHGKARFWTIENNLKKAEEIDF